jgi:hypothetical protein
LGEGEQKDFPYIIFHFPFFILIGPEIADLPSECEPSIEQMENEKWEMISGK